MKTKVRNISLIALALVLVLACCLALVGCGDSSDSGEGTIADAQYDADGNLVRKDGYQYIFYHYNFDGQDDLYRTQEVEYYSRPTIDMSCTLVGVEGDYMLMGWYTDAACISSSRYDTSKAVTTDVDLYALWYKGSRFEAEKTNLNKSDGTRREFQGYSQNSNPVRSDSNCSNGYYIGDMYVNECYIYFEIESSAAVSGASISICAALDQGWDEKNGGFTNDVTITSNQYKLLVNGTQCSYSTMTFSGAANLSDGEKTEFAIYDLGTVNLVEGANTIRFEVANSISGEGGTQGALAPLMDYMTLYVPTDVTLQMTEYSNAADA